MSGGAAPVGKHTQQLLIGQTRCFHEDQWFREMTLGGVTFLAPLDQQEAARHILARLPAATPSPAPSASGGVDEAIEDAIRCLPSGAVRDELIAALPTVEAMAEALELARTGMEVAAGIEHPAFLGFALTLDKINATLARYHGRTES